ncbi:hypothetical protein CWE08_07040 [Aliidiomarina iranensis]|uniref:Lipoprotein n=1 Tax=Aliidiomarina iranensis TaxID=1434071 RepID=A0A432VW73_9GAMM|nr:hypothetical protein [Aliidiomarina iranensis]RUO20850.1 hypothetical protein CWE08_07040 [Aliidiomarina iranensis]
MHFSKHFLQPVRTLLLLAVATLVITGCQSAPNREVGPSMTGPSGVATLGNTQRTYRYDSDIYLNVAVPVFDPGLPLDRNGNVDYDQLVEDDIWPQIRRLEANRFALDTKRALSETNSFGSIYVTPDTNSSADLYVLGKINHSDTETISISIRVVDGTNATWGQETFEYRVSEGYYRDAFNSGGNPYDPIFTGIANYVYDLLKEKSEAQKANIQAVSELRYAAMYSPETMGDYLERKSTRNGVTYNLTGFPAEEDAMLQRIRLIRAEEENFISDLQDNYAAFYAQSDSSYSDYHRETLPIAVGIRKQKAQRGRQQATALFAAIGAGLLMKNSGSTAGEVGAIVLGATSLYNVGGAIESNRNLANQRQLLTEMGQNLDIEVTPQVIEYRDQTIELQGSAREQYTQLRAQLLEIYKVEATPDQNL